jgi:hypothetical protein
MQLWSTAFVLDPAEAPDEDEMCYLGLGAWRRLHEEYKGAGRIFAQLRVEGETVYCALGHPLSLEGVMPEVAGGEETLYIPQRVAARLCIEATGQEAEVMWLTDEAFPAATRIVLRPHDSAFYHADAKEELERELSRRGLLECGQMISVPLAALGGYMVDFDVVVTEPANIVLLQGEEVVMEFEASLDATQASLDATQAAAAAPVAPLEPAEDFGGAMMPVPPVAATAAPPPGQRLGGEVRYNPDGTRWNPWRDGKV